MFEEITMVRNSVPAMVIAGIMGTISFVWVVAVVVGWSNVVLPLARSVKHTGLRIYFFTKHYGSAGLMLWCFGNREVWQIQLQVVRSTHDADAMKFKKAAQEDSNIIAVAVSTQRSVLGMS